MSCPSLPDSCTFRSLLLLSASDTQSFGCTTASIWNTVQSFSCKCRCYFKNGVVSSLLLFFSVPVEKDQRLYIITLVNVVCVRRVV